jgi:hypothetical protein
MLHRFTVECSMEERLIVSADASRPDETRPPTRNEFAALRQAVATALADEIALCLAGYKAALQALQDDLRGSLMNLLYDAYAGRAVDPVALREAMELLADHHAIREDLVSTPPQDEGSGPWRWRCGCRSFKAEE